MSDFEHQDELGALPDPGTDPTAGRLARALSADADRIDPSDRLAEIRAAARRPRRWLPAVAAAAAVVVVAGGVGWAATHRTSAAPPAGGAQHATPTPRPVAVQTPLPHTSTTTQQLNGHHLPIWVYFLGQGESGLFRESFGWAPDPGTDASHVQAALRIAADPRRPVQGPDYSPWLPGTSGALEVAQAPGSRTFVVTLPDAETAANGRSREEARLAAQQLVWTASSFLSDPSVALKIQFAGGSGRLFGALTTAGRTFHRPAAAESFLDLAPVWVTPLDSGRGPTATSSYARGSTISATGTACTFEGTVQWQVLQGSGLGGSVVRSGHTQATAGCPSRGRWTVNLTPLHLAPGSYTFRAYELSAEDGVKVVGEDFTTFTIR